MEEETKSEQNDNRDVILLYHLTRIESLLEDIVKLLSRSQVSPSA